MKTFFNFIAILFFIFFCSCDKNKLPKDDLSNVKFTLYSINSNKIGVKYDLRGKPNYKDTVSLLSCSAVLRERYSYISPDSARYFFEWQDQNGNPLSGIPKNWFFTTLVYKNNILVSAGYESIQFGYQGYNPRNSKFIQVLKQKKKQLNRWLFLYAKDKKMI